MSGLKSALRWLWGLGDDFGWRELIVGSWITWSLLIVTVVVGTLDVLLPESDGVGPLTEVLGHSTARVASGEWWRLVTSTFVNSPIGRSGFLFSANGHLLANMLGLVLVGPRLERSIGHARTLALYMTATVVASAAALAALSVSWDNGGGSSASIYGLLGGTLITAFLARRSSPRDGRYFVVALVGILFVPGAIVSGVAAALGYRYTNIAHGVGFVVGVVLATAWLRFERRRAVALIVPILVVASAVLVVTRSVQARGFDPRVHRAPIDSRSDLVTHAFGSIWGNGDGFVTRLDLSTNRVAARIKIGITPDPAEPGGGAMVAARDSLWVSGDRSVVEIDPASNAIKSRIALAGVGPWGLSASADVLWAALPTEDRVARIDLNTRRVSITRVGDEPYTVLANRRDVWVANYLGRSISRLDPRTGRVIATTRLDAEPYWLEFKRSLWVGTTDALINLDPRSLRVVDRLELPQYFYAFTLDDQGGAWVSNRFDFSISRVDLRSGRVLERIRVGLARPAGMTFAEDLWAADPWRQSVLRIALNGDSP